VDLQIQTAQNPHTQATTKSSSNLHGFGDIKGYVQKALPSLISLLSFSHICAKLFKDGL